MARECQQGIFCPDKIGHFFGFAWFAYTLTFLFPNHSWLSYILLSALVGLLVEIAEALYFTIFRGRRFLNWFRVRDTQYDLLVDFGGACVGLLLVQPFPHSPIVAAILAAISLVFIPFTGWEQWRRFWRIDR